MEFRCPACDTSYRLPVQLGQQVRCARCNHVWRIAETDFVIANEAPEEAEMPEEFSEPASQDEDGEDPGLQEVRDSLSTLFDGSEGRLGEPDQPVPEAAAAGPREHDWPDHDAREPVSEPALDEPSAGSSSAGVDVADEPEHARSGEPDDRATDAYAGLGADHGNQYAAKEDLAEEDSPQKQIADNWFGRSSGDATEAAVGTGEAEHEGSFERIMEGIEEVIAETSKGEHFVSDPADTAPGGIDGDALSALIGGTGASGIHSASSDIAERDSGALEDESTSGAKVVRFSPPGGDQRHTETLRREDAPPSETWEDAADTGDSLSRMMDTLSVDRGATGADRYHGTERPQTASAEQYFAEDGADDAYEDDAEAPSEAQGHFDDLRSVSGNAMPGAHAGSEDPYQRDIGDSAEAYYDADHVALQRDSLAFSADRVDFAADDDDHETDWADHANTGTARYEDASDHNQSTAYRDDHALMSARPGDAEDDALLAEYDFGDEAVEDAGPPEIAAGQVRRGPGILVVGAAWALFLAVLAGAGWSALSFRERIVEALPASERVYAAIGFPVSQTPLALEDVSYALKGEPANMLTLTGRVKHTGSSLIEMPNLKITVRDEADQTLLEDSRFLGQAALLPGETLDFEVALDVPAERLRTVELKF